MDGDVDFSCKNLCDVQKPINAIFAIQSPGPVVTRDYGCALAASVYASLHNGILAHRYVDGFGGQLRISCRVEETIRPLIPRTLTMIIREATFGVMKNLIESATSSPIDILEDLPAANIDLHFGGIGSHDTSESASVDVSDGSAFDVDGDLSYNSRLFRRGAPGIITSSEEHGYLGVILHDQIHIADVAICPDIAHTVGDTTASDVLDQSIPGYHEIGATYTGIAPAPSALNIPDLRIPG